MTKKKLEIPQAVLDKVAKLGGKKSPFFCGMYEGAEVYIVPNECYDENGVALPTGIPTAILYKSEQALFDNEYGVDVFELLSLLSETGE